MQHSKFNIFQDQKLVFRFYMLFFYRASLILKIELVLVQPLIREVRSILTIFMKFNMLFCRLERRFL